MGIETTKYVRKPLYVDAVQVTDENFDEMVTWCNGKVEIEESNSKKFIRIWVHNPMGPRQTKAFVGDWILRHTKGFKIYTPKAFEASFDEVPNPNKQPKTVEEVTTSPANLEGPAETTTVKANLEEPGTFQRPHMGEAAEKVENTDTEEIPVVQPVNTEGKRVLTHREQVELGHEEVTALLRSGEAVLEQDLAA